MIRLRAAQRWYARLNDWDPEVLVCYAPVASKHGVLVEYIVSSRGRPIGTTALGFVRIGDCVRSGWFHPNALGEELMPDVAMVLPAVRAFVCRHQRDDPGQPFAGPKMRHSSLFADLAEAFHRVEALDLTLHHADGTRIPTSLVGIQDTEQLLELSRCTDLYNPSDPLVAEEAAYEEFDGEFGVDPDPDQAWDPLPHDCLEPAGDLDRDIDDERISDEQPTGLPRYQVHVLLVEENAIP